MKPLIVWCLMMGFSVSSSAFEAAGPNFVLDSDVGATVTVAQADDDEPTAEGSGPQKADDEGSGAGLTDAQKRKIKGFGAKYFSLKMNRNLSKEVDDNVLIFFLGSGCLGCVAGPVWLPMLLLEEPAPDGYLEDGLINWGAHVLVQCALNLPMWLLQLPFNPLYLADAWWWTPVNAINLWDDARKNQKVRARLEREWLNNLVATTPSKTSMLY